MTFLSPSLLWFFGAVSIPIAIHLLSRLRQNKVEFSSIRFIKELETSSIRKVQIQKLIILLLRMLAIMCLAMMMAQPVTRGFMPGWLAAEQDSKLVIVLDNSASMSVQAGERTFLERSKNVAMSLVPLFKDETTISIVQTCPPKVVFKGKPNDPQIRNSVRSIRPTASHDHIWREINKLLDDETIDQPIKECVIFSDMMHLPDSSFLYGLDNIGEWKFYFIEPSPNFDNLGIVNASPVSRIKTMNQLVKLNTRVKNSGTLTKPNIPLELVFNDQRVGQVVSEFDSGKEKEFLFQAYPAEVGILQGEIILPKDDYELDNYWYLSMPIMDQIRCSIIGSNAKDISILEMMLRSIDPENKFLILESRIQPDLNRLFLDDLDVIVIHDAKGITAEGIKDIDRFLKEGGGVIWFQGKHDKDQFDDQLFTTIGFPEIDGLINAGQGFFSSQIVSKNSDITNDIQVRNIDKELPEIYKYIRAKLGLHHKVHWVLNNDDPLLLEFSKGSGTIFYFSTLLDLRWNDLPIRGMTVPLLYRLLIFTGTDEVNTAPVLVDEEKWISVEESKLRNKWEVISPSGRTEMIVPEYDREGINVPSTNELGIYQVYSNGEKFTSFPTRLHYNEYIEKRITQNDIETFLNKEQTRWLTMQENFVEIFSETRQGKSLWKFFLIAAIIFLLLETMIGRPEPLKMKSNEE